jgi:hypothetical protein
MTDYLMWLKEARQSANEAGYALRDRRGSILALVSMLGAVATYEVSEDYESYADEFGTVYEDVDEIVDQRFRVVVWILDAAYDEGMTAHAEDARKWDPSDFDESGPCREWVAEQHRWDVMRANMRSKRLARIALN